MRKLMFSLASLMLLCTGMAFARDSWSYGIPENPYVTGVEIATKSSTTNWEQIGSTGTTIIIYGVGFSTGAGTDYIDIIRATSTTPISGRVTMRIYNTNASTGIAVSAGDAGQGNCGRQWFYPPIRFNDGAIWKTSVATQIQAEVYYWEQRSAAARP